MLRTAGILLGVVLIVAGITLALVTGLEPAMIALGVLVMIGGGSLIYFLTKSSDGSVVETVVTSGRSFQKPLPPPGEKPKIDRRL